MHYLINSKILSCYLINSKYHNNFLSFLLLGTIEELAASYEQKVESISNDLQVYMKFFKYICISFQVAYIIYLLFKKWLFS